MADTKEIEILYGVTTNLGNYESERIDISIRATVEPGEDENEVIDGYFSFLKSKVDEIKTKIVAKRHI